MSIEFEFDVADDSNPNFIKVLAKNNGVDIMDFREVGPGGGNGQYRAVCGDPADGQEFLSQLYDMPWEEVLDQYGDFGLLGSSGQPVGEAVEEEEPFAPGKQHRDYYQWMAQLDSYAKSKGIYDDKLDARGDDIMQAFEDDYSPKEVIDTFFNQDEGMDEAGFASPGPGRFLVSYDETGRGMGDEQMVAEFPSQGQAMDFIGKQLAAGKGTDEQWLIDDLTDDMDEAHKFTPGKQSNDKKDREDASRRKTKPGKGKWSRADGKKIDKDTNEGFTMNLKSFFIHEAIWTGDGGRGRRGKEDADTWRDRRKDSKFDGSAHERDDKEGRWDKIDRDAQKDEAVGADTDEPKYGDYPPKFDGGGDDPGHEDEPGSCPECHGNGFSVQGPDGQWEECSNCTDPASGRTLPPDQWKSNANLVPNDDDEGFHEPDYEAGKADWMKDEASGERAEKAGHAKDDFDEFEPLPDKGPKMDDFGGEDPSDEMFFGDKTQDDYVGTITDPASADDEFKGGPVDDFGPEEEEPGFGSADMYGSGLDPAELSMPDDDVMLPDYEGDPNYRLSNQSKYDFKNKQYVDPKPDAQGFFPRAPLKKKA